MIRRALLERHPPEWIGVERIGREWRLARRRLALPPPRKAKTSIPQDFAITSRVQTWASQHQFADLDQHLEVFKAKCLANGYTYVDWEAAFMEAVRADWAKLRGGSSTNRRGTNSVLHADDDLTEAQR